MRLIDKEFTRHPFYGIRRMTEWLKRQDYAVNRKRVGRLMRLMGLMPIYPKPRLSLGDKESKKYPYLLRELKIAWPNQVWCTDITYIRMPKGFVYLVVVMDWYSRYVLSWKISNSLDTAFCMEALEEALQKGKPEIFNSDQGSQFTSLEFTGRLEKENIRISMDGRGRAFDNIFIERLWRSVKYEEVYIKEYSSVQECVGSLREYFRFYNEERLHQALQYKTTLEVHQQAFAG
jgi:putative transposase